MRRMHIIDDFNRMGGEIYYREEKYARDPELLEAYRCGKKDGWREAMEESEGYGERHYGDRGHIVYREGREWGEDPYMERRRRDSRGRYM